MSTFDPYGADRRTPVWVWVIGALLVVLIAVGLVFVFTGGDNEQDSSESVPETTSSTAAASSEPSAAEETSAEDPAAEGQACGDFTDAPAEEVPEDLTVTRETLGFVTYPVSGSSGPLSTDPYPTCFAHTAYGAALAAAAAFAAVNEPGIRDAWAEDYASRSLPPLEPSETTVRISGYRIAAYSQEQADVDVLAALAGEGTYRFPLEMWWDDGRWVLDIDAADIGDGGPEPYTSGYTLWQG